MKQHLTYKAMNGLRKITGKYSLTAALLFIMCFTAKAQFEPQFTQYMFNETFINPAYAGSRDHIAMTGLYRNQWVGIEGAPKTQTFSIHSPMKNEKIGLGFNLLNEEIGVTRDLGVFASYAYRIPMQNSFLSMGLQGGLINHTERLSDVKIQDQGDYAFFGTPRLTVPNFGFGTYFYSRNFYAGLSIPRMLQNYVNAESGKAQNRIQMNYWHYYFMGGFVQPVSESIKLKPTFMVKAVNGAPIEADIGIHALFSEILWVGASYRTGDSWAAILSIQASPQLRIGYSYDYTTTKLRSYSSGTHEITFGYDFSFNKDKVVTPRYF